MGSIISVISVFLLRVDALYGIRNDMYASCPLKRISYV